MSYGPRAEAIGAEPSVAEMPTTGHPGDAVQERAQLLIRLKADQLVGAERLYQHLMVGQSDQAILGNPPQLTAALNLTLWLMHRFHIELRNVIGHNESLTSPFHRELVPSFRCQTHPPNREQLRLTLVLTVPRPRTL